MTTLDIRLSGQPPESTNLHFASNTWDYDLLWRQLAPAGKLTGMPLARLIRRLQARYPVTLELRPDTNPEPLILWLTNAGAEVTLTNPSAATSSPNN